MLHCFITMSLYWVLKSGSVSPPTSFFFFFSKLFATFIFKVCLLHMVYNLFLLFYPFWLECLVLLSLIWLLIWLDVSMPHCCLFSICPICILFLSAYFPAFCIIWTLLCVILFLLLFFIYSPLNLVCVVSLRSMICIFSLSQPISCSYETTSKIY